MHRNKNTISAHNPHTIRTQYAHNPHTIRTNTRQQQRYMQHTEDNREQDNTTQDTNNIAQPQRKEHSTDYLHKYSFDLYHEQIYINNSNTIELYTISKENI